MPSSNSYKASVIGAALVDVIDAEKVALGLKKVWYGTEPLIDKTPCVQVDVTEIVKNIATASTPPNTTNDIDAHIYIYYSRFGPQEMVRKECDALLESLVTVLEADFTLGGLVIFGHVTRINPVGISETANEMLKSGRLVWSAKSRTALGT